MDNAIRTVLVVDDDPNIVTTSSAILSSHGFEVASATSVHDALRLLLSQKFNALISDLNLGAPGDGFIVLSAMRRLQPEAITIMVTGYPAFEEAFDSIRSQVDCTLAKPACPTALLGILSDRAVVKGTLGAIARVGEVLRTHSGEVLRRWEDMSLEPRSRERLTAAPAAEIKETIAAVVDTLAGDGDGKEVRRLARRRGRNMRRARVSPATLVYETRLLDQALMETIRQHVTEIELSHLLGDIKALNDLLQQHSEYAVEGYYRGIRHRRLFPGGIQ